MKFIVFYSLFYSVLGILWTNPETKDVFGVIDDSSKGHLYVAVDIFITSLAFVLK